MLQLGSDWYVACVGAAANATLGMQMVSIALLDEASLTQVCARQPREKLFVQVKFARDQILC